METGKSSGLFSQAETAFFEKEFAHLRYLEDRWKDDHERIAKSRHQCMQEMIAFLKFNAELILEREDAEKLTSKNQNQLIMPAYIWHPSVHGGYYEESGQINGNIPASQIKLFGGYLENGQPVSKVLSANSKN